ncbi:MAG: stage III sporulation protein AF [Blautia sp.]|nr:stage III sporulation protein AF [Blautia sp.]MDY3998344.1 stage III sporulation protein AF [Blautia sp.]
MKAELYQWMKNLAVFYILFTAFLHLVPDKKYERYVRLFMGFLLILMMCTPVFALLGKGKELVAKFDLHYDGETQFMEKEEIEKMQILYLKKGYEEEIREKIVNNLGNTGIKLEDAAVHIEEERVSVVLTVREKLNEEQERRVADALWESCGIGEGDYTIHVALHGENAVDRTFTSGTASGGGGHAGIP